MDFSHTPIKQIIPQRPPFLMVDRVVCCDENDADIEFLVAPENVLAEDNALSAPGVIENMAQSCAAFMGCGCLLRGVPITIGYIGEIRNALISRLPQCGRTIRTHVHVVSEFLNLIMADVKVTEDDDIIATARIKVANTDIVANITD